MRRNARARTLTHPHTHTHHVQIRKFVRNDFTHEKTPSEDRQKNKTKKLLWQTDRVGGEDVGVSDKSASHTDGTSVLVEREVRDAWLEALQTVQDGSLRETSTTSGHKLH